MNLFSQRIFCGADAVFKARKTGVARQTERPRVRAEDGLRRALEQVLVVPAEVLEDLDLTGVAKEDGGFVVLTDAVDVRVEGCAIVHNRAVLVLGDAASLAVFGADAFRLILADVAHLKQLVER